MSEPLNDAMLDKLRTFDLKPDDQVWMATVDRLQAALTAAQAERDEAVKRLAKYEATTAYKVLVPLDEYEAMEQAVALAAAATKAAKATLNWDDAKPPRTRTDAAWNEGLDTGWKQAMQHVQEALATPNELIEVLLSKVKGYDEAVALVAVLREELQTAHDRMDDLSAADPLTVADMSAKQDCLWCSGCGYTPGLGILHADDCPLLGFRAALAKSNEQVAALLLDAERGRRVADREWWMKFLMEHFCGGYCTLRGEQHCKCMTDTDAIIAALTEVGTPPL